MTIISTIDQTSLQIARTRTGANNEKQIGRFKRHERPPSRASDTVERSRAEWRWLVAVPVIPTKANTSDPGANHAR